LGEEITILVDNMPLIERNTVFEYELISLSNIQSNLFLPNLIGTNISVRNRHVFLFNQQRFPTPTFGFYLQFGLNRMYCVSLLHLKQQILSRMFYCHTSVETKYELSMWTIELATSPEEILRLLLCKHINICLELCM
jgi:hypothetical protein